MLSILCQDNTTVGKSIDLEQRICILLQYLRNLSKSQQVIVLHGFLLIKDHSVNSCSQSGAKGVSLFAPLCSDNCIRYALT